MVITNVLESNDLASRDNDEVNEILILRHETNQFTEIRLNANVTIETLKEEVLKKFNAISEQKIEACCLLNLNGDELQTRVGGKDKIIILSNCTLSNSEQNDFDSSLIQPSTTISTNPNGDILDSRSDRHFLMNSTSQESRISQLESDINCRLDSFQELIQNRIIKLGEEQNLRHCQLEKQVKYIYDTLAKQTWNTASGESNEVTEIVVKKKYGQERGGSCSFIVATDTKKETKMEREPYSYVDGLDPLETFSLNQNDDVNDRNRFRSSKKSMFSRNSVSRNCLQKEFSLDAGSFPAHDSCSEETVKQKPTASIQQSPDTISQNSSSVFSEKNNANDFDVLFGLVGSTTSSLNYVEQKVIPNQGIGSNAVCDILGLQSDDISSQNLASSKKEEQRKKGLRILKTPKRRMKDSIKRRLSKIFKRIKK